MSIIDMLPSIRRGEVPVYREGRRSEGGTLGHRADQPGLRGHSVGEEFPYRVVGKGDGTWEVHRNGCAQRLVGLSCTGAHVWARHLARRA